MILYLPIDDIEFKRCRDRLLSLSRTPKMSDKEFFDCILIDESGLIYVKVSEILFSDYIRECRGAKITEILN